MESVRSLRDVFAGLADTATGPDADGATAPDPASLLAEHDGLPDELLVTAIGSYAGTAPAEVAEHLAPAAGADAATGLGLLASAPSDIGDGEVPLFEADQADELDLTSGPDDTDGLDEATGLDDATGLDLGDLGSADNLDSFDQAGNDSQNTGQPADDTQTDDALSHNSQRDNVQTDDALLDDDRMDGPDEVGVPTPVDADDLTPTTERPDVDEPEDHSATDLYPDHDDTGQLPELEDLHEAEDFDEFDG